MGTLKGKKAIVTGGGQGIGAAIVEELANQGCNVAIHYHSSAEGADNLKCEIRKKDLAAESFQADLTFEDQAEKMVNEAVNFLGGLDILVNNTGDLLERRKLEETDMNFWQKIFDINMTSMMLVTKYAVPYLAKNKASSIVNLSSLAGRKGGHAGSLSYSTFKGAVLAWTRGLSTELGARGIRVNALAPGLILGTRFHATHTTDASANKTIHGIPLGRAGTPEDIARTVAYFASEYDGFITGATLDINGGVYCT